jgi:hypothetical protein
MALIISMTVFYNTTPELDRHVPSLEGSSCPCDTRVSQIHTELWRKQLPPSGGKNKSSIEKLVVQGRENQDKCTALIFRVEDRGRLVIYL